MTSTITDRLYGQNSAVAIKAPCVAVSSTNIELSGLGAFTTPGGGSYTPNQGDRILVIGETDQTTNGIYCASATAWQRTGDFDGSYDVVQGTICTVLIANGSGLAFYQLTTADPIIGTSNLVFTALAQNPNLNYPITAAEQTAGIVPSNYTYTPGDPRRYGAVGDGQTDDTTALNDCFAVNQTVNFPGCTFTFLITKVVTAAVTGQQINGNGSTIKLSADFVPSANISIALDVTATDVTVQDLNFDSAYAGASENNQYLNFAATALRGSALRCHFQDLVGGGSNLNAALAFLKGADDCRAIGCTGISCPGTVFCQGAHCLIDGCTAQNPSDVSFVLHSSACVGSSIVNCKVYNTAGAAVSYLIDVEEGASDWVIANNYCYGVKDGGGIAAVTVSYDTVVRGGVISGNVIDGGSLVSTNPSALLSVSAYYKGCLVTGNKLGGLPSGNVGNRALIVPALQTRVLGNTIDASQPATGTVAAAAASIAPAGDFLDFFDNWINATGSSYGVEFSAGDNASARVFFKGGSFLGAVESINTALNAPTNCPLWFEDIVESTATAFLNPSSADSIESYFNTYHALEWPHSIKGHRRIFGNAAPVSGAWLVGDVVYNVSPIAAAAPGWVCTTAGSPGTWTAMADLA